MMQLKKICNFIQLKEWGSNMIKIKVHTLINFFFQGQHIFQGWRKRKGMEKKTHYRSSTVHGMEERTPPPWRGRRDASNASMICGVLPIGGAASTDASHTLERVMHAPIIYFLKKNILCKYQIVLDLIQY